METRKNLRFILSNFKIKKDQYYFNYANYSKVPKSVIRETHKLNSLFGYGSVVSKKVEKYQNEVRSHVAAVFGGKSENWYFSGPVSSAISTLLLQIIRDFKVINNKIPTISTYKRNFPSLVLPAISLEKFGLCKLDLIEYPENGIDENWCNKNINSDIFIISLVDFFNGQIHDLDLIYSICKSKNVNLIVDFSQFPYWGILNVNNYPGVVFVSVLHKWLMGYPGHSISYIDYESIPFFLGWQNISNIIDYDLENIIKTHEISNKSPLPFCSFEGAFKFVNSIGLDKINRYIKSSSNGLLEKLNDLGSKYPGLKIIQNNENFRGIKSSIISISVGSKTKDLFKYLYNYNIIASYFNVELIRFSTSFTTSKEEIDFLCGKIDKWCEINLT